jgi:hypothetical protein
MEAGAVANTHVATEGPGWPENAAAQCGTKRPKTYNIECERAQVQLYVQHPNT